VVFFCALNCSTLLLQLLLSGLVSRMDDGLQLLGRLLLLHGLLLAYLIGRESAIATAVPLSLHSLSHDGGLPLLASCLIGNASCCCYFK
ncbi:hypothetical protein Dimus_033596, partial [Dionaea muscipula]